MNRRIQVTIVVGCLLLLGVAGPIGGFGAAASGHDGSGDPVNQFDDPFPQTDDAEADTVILEAAVDADGDAVWTVEYRFLLSNNESEAAFEDLQASIAENESAYVGRFTERMESTVATAENSTGREMSVSNVTVETRRISLPREYGVVSYSFTWGGFAVVDGDSIVIGDAISGLFLDEASRFVATWPTGYEARSVTPAPTRSTSTSATWDGPIDFATDEPRVTIAPAELVTDTDSPTEPVDGTSPGSPSEFPISGAIITGIVGIGIAAGLFLFFRRRGEEPESPVGAVEPDYGSGPDTTSPTEDESSMASTSADSTGDSGTPVEGAPAGDEESVDEELLSPEERVLKLIREHGGRMKQQEVVQEMGWTDARTSQVVGSLREEAKLESFRLGRENVLKLPDEDDELP